MYARSSTMKKSVIALLAVAAGVNLTWAGAVTFRVLIDLPARHRIGPSAFAELCRATDLSAGLVFYPVLAVGSAVLACAAWVSAWRTEAPRSIRWLAAAAAASTLLVLGVTGRAAPLMFRIGASPNDPTVVGPLADQFTALTNVRALLADAAAAALLWALTSCALRAAQDK
jgi:hypothetical protein